MAEQIVEEDVLKKMTPEMRYYYRNRAQELEKDRERYNNKPEVIAKRAERERKRAEREAEKEAKKQAEKEAKRIEKERIRQEKLAIAEATKRRFKEKPIVILTDSPAE
jgi:hypothetical protein